MVLKSSLTRDTTNSTSCSQQKIHKNIISHLKIKIKDANVNYGDDEKIL